MGDCAKLFQLAARRGEKGLSTIGREAVTRHLVEASERGAATRKAQGALGQLSDHEATDLSAAIQSLRERWR